jgi:L-alanine-DL-glutamate epimerase-like enolase superfamily enzyme
MHRPLTLTVRTETFSYRAPFRISGHVFTATELVVVELADADGHVGRGEAAGVYYTGDDLAAMLADLQRVRPQVEAGTDRVELQQLLAPGGARNALDCALWDFEAKRAGRPVWQLAGLPSPQRRETTFTLGAEDPQRMAEAAGSFADATALKLKLTGELELDCARVAAVRNARPDCWLGVDANQGHSRATLPALLDCLVEHEVRLLEQPVRRGEEAQLDGLARPLPFAADESCLSLAEVDPLAGRFDVVNIKLDKCGGLTEAIQIAARARQLGMGVMVGNMMGSSLSMAPSFLLAQICDLVDLDGPIFLASDRMPGVVYRAGTIWCPEDLWGAGKAKIEARSASA